jgi:hypothetical protein
MLLLTLSLVDKQVPDIREVGQQQELEEQMVVAV